MTKPFNFDPYITAWDEGDTGYFKVARITVRETRGADELEKAAKHIARDIQAEVMYAWDLGKDRSDAWWLGWGGFDLEEEIPFHAAMSLPDVTEKLEAFDPGDNEFECASLDEYRELLFNAYDEGLSAENLKTGFLNWVDGLNEEARKTLREDLESWSENAKKAS